MMTGAAGCGAGVGKPPREETAGEGVERLRVRYGDLIFAEDALSEGTTIRRTGGRPSGSRAGDFLRGLMKVCCSIWTDSWKTERVVRQPAEDQRSERADLQAGSSGIVMTCRS